MSRHLARKMNSTIEASSVPGSLDTGLTCLVMLARFHQIAADPQQLAHQFKGMAEQVSQFTSPQHSASDCRTKNKKLALLINGLASHYN